MAVPQIGAASRLRADLHGAACIVHAPEGTIVGTTSHGTDWARRRTLVAALSVALPAGALAVTGCMSPTEPPPPPGGGVPITLSFEQFEATVEPALVSHGCDATGDCHGGGIRGTLELSPPGAKDAQFDFAQVALQVTTTPPEASRILTEPLALDAGGTPHGVKVFASTSDPDYQAILAWIQDGISSGAAPSEVTP